MKRFIFKYFLYSLPIVVPLIFFAVFINPHLHGDIGPLGYVTFDDDYGMFELAVDNKVVNCRYTYHNFNDSCILTVGDSFSQTNKNNGEISYNYFLANYTDYNVINLNQQWDVNPFVRFLYMSKTISLPKIVVIECVERYLVEHVLNTNISMHAIDIVNNKLLDTISDVKPKSKSLLEKTQEWIKRELCLIGYENPIKSARLTQSYFSCENREGELYFYVDDLRNVELTDSMMMNVIETLDSLFKYTETIGVQLYILIAADKYGVYQDYIVDNPFPKHNVSDKLCTMYGNPYLINSKDTLSRMVASGVQDVYWCNNTHWSPVGAEAVAVQVAKVINKTQGKEIFIVD